MPSGSTADGFLEHLPVPCLYLTQDRIITYTNAGARSLVFVQNGDKPLVGSAIESTNFVPQRLQDAFEELSHPDKAKDGATISWDATCKVVLQSPHDSWIWKLSHVQIDEQPYFCLLAQPGYTDFAMLGDICKPSFQSADHYVTMIAHDSSIKRVNEYGHHDSGSMAHWIQQLRGRGSAYSIWNEDFTAPLSPSESVSSTAFRAGTSMISLKRGIKSSTTGQRTILDNTVTLVSNPYTDKVLGCIVQIRPAQEWAEYLQHYDISTKQSSVMVKTMTLSGEFDYFCRATERYCDSTSDALCNNWQDYIHPQDLPGLKASIAEGIAKDEAQIIETRYRSGDTYRYFSDRLAPFKDKSGKTSRWYCISTDIHELVVKRRQADLFKERLVKSLRDTDSVVYEIDPDYIIVEIYGAMQVSSLDVEMEVQQFIGMRLTDAAVHIEEEFRPQFLEMIDAVLQGRSARRMLEYKLGDKWLQTVIVPMYGDTALSSSTATITGIFGISTNITERVKSRQVALQLDAMQETSRLKDQFVANVSHELRTPIAGLLGLLELLSETSLDKEQSLLAKSLRTSAQGLFRIVNDILDFSKVEADKMEIEPHPFDLRELLIDVQSTHEIVASNKNLALEVELPKTDLKVLGDALRLRQILDNLLSNSIKFTKEGTVQLSTSHKTTDTGIVVTFIIEDTGIGISEKTLTKLFQPFAQADESTTRLYGGTGLGLSIARRLAQAMGGDVSLTSVEGQGSTSTLVVPFDWASTVENLSLDESSALDKPNGHTNGTSDLGDLRVLVAEDNPVNMIVIKGHLRKLGLKHVATASNGLEAVSHVTTAISGPDLILMDCQMPLLDGFDATRQLRTQQYKQPILALTASATQGYRQKCLDAGMNDYISKPFTRQELLDVITTWAKTQQSDSHTRPP